MQDQHHHAEITVERRPGHIAATAKCQTCNDTEQVFVGTGGPPASTSEAPATS